MKYIVFVAYYVYATLLIAGTAYLVFYKGISGWWFLLTAVFLNTTPSFKSENEKIEKPTD